MSKPRRELYRLPQQGKVAGVCAGVADYFGFETWLVRIVFISGVLLSGAMFVVAYIAAWFILDVKPGHEKGSKKHQWQNHWHAEDSNAKVRSHFSDRPIEVKEKVWQAGEPPKQAFHDIAGQFRDLEKRLQHLESYVTSTEFTVAREINKL